MVMWGMDYEHDSEIGLNRSD